MEIDFAFVCDYADMGGKINALGIGFDTIFAKEIPHVHSHMHLIAQFRASITEAGRKKLTVQIIDADGASVGPSIEGEMEVRSPDVGSEAVGRLGIEFKNVQFERYGHYSLHILIDGNEVQRIGFRVAEPPATG